MIQTTKTPAEITAEITAEQTAAADQYQTHTLISPAGKQVQVSRWMVEARIAKGWTRA